MANPGSKLLSFCLSGRNDDYSGPFVRRLSLCLNYLAFSASSINQLQEIEVVVTDWNSESPLAGALHLSPDAASICTIIRVPPSVAAPLSFQETGFHTTRAVNVALRRASGQFHACMPADTLISNVALAAILDILRGDRKTSFDPAHAFMLTSRIFLPFDIPDDQISLSELDRLLQNSHASLYRHRPHMNGISSGYSAVINHRALTDEFCGVNENMGGWGFSDIDLGVRISSKYPLAELSYFGVTLYDFASFSSAKTNRMKDNRTNGFERVAFQLHQPDWGLAGYELQATPAIPSTTPRAEPAKPQVLGQMLANSDLRREVRSSIHPQIRSVPPFHLLIYFLARYFRPWQYLEFAIPGDYPALLAASASPWTEIYYLLPPHPMAPDSNSMDVVTLATRMFDIPHANTFRTVGGDSLGAVARLLKSFPGNPSFDLVALRVNRPAHMAQCFTPAVPHLSRSGALAISAEQAQPLAEFIEIMERTTALRVAYLSRRHHCAVLIPPGHSCLSPDSADWPEADAKLRPVHRWPLQVPVANRLIRLGENLKGAAYCDWRSWIRQVFLR